MKVLVVGFGRRPKHSSAALSEAGAFLDRLFFAVPSGKLTTAMANSGWKKHAITAASVLLALLFLFAGGTKLAGLEMHAESFQGWGYPIWFMYVTGLLEVTAAVLLLIPGKRFYGAALLVCIMLGAIATHLKAGEANMLAPPVVLLLLSGSIAWLQRPGAGASLPG